MSVLLYHVQEGQIIDLGNCLKIKPANIEINIHTKFIWNKPAVVRIIGGSDNRRSTAYTF